MRKVLARYKPQRYGWYVQIDTRPFPKFWNPAWKKWEDHRIKAQAYRTKKGAESEALLLSLRRLTIAPAYTLQSVRVVRYGMATMYGYVKDGTSSD